MMTKGDYKRWLNSNIWVTANGKAPRSDFVFEFYHSLKDWVKGYGYTMGVQLSPRLLAFWMYTCMAITVYRLDTLVYYPEPIHRDWDEDLDAFDMRITSDAVEDFMDSWRHVEGMDFNSETGQRIRFELPRLVYTYLDLSNSRTGKLIANRVEATDSDSEQEKGMKQFKSMDDYLVDSAEGWH